MNFNPAGGGIPPPDLPFPAPAFLENNPYFGAGFGLAVLGTGLSFLKVGTSQLYLSLQRKFLITLEVTSKDPSFFWVLHWTNKQFQGNARRLILQTQKTTAASGKSVTEFNFTPATGIHFLKYKKTWFYVERDRDTTARDLQTGEPWESIRFTTVGTTSEIYNDLMNEAKQLAQNRDSQQTVIYTSWGHHGWKPFGPPRKRRSLNSVILDKGMAPDIVSDVNEFLNSADWYRERGIPYRRGYLLHGPPGSGKSSFVAALAGHIGYDICCLNMNQTGLTDDHVSLSLSTIPEKSLVLLEDIDAAFHDRKPTGGINHITFSGFLNALDGVSAGEERIVFMTTNHINHLDAALVRPGRVDVMHKLDAASHYQTYTMYKTFYPEHEHLASKFADIVAGRDISMAELQGFFMINKLSAEDAFNDADLFCTQVLAGRQGVKPGMLFTHAQ